MSEGPRWASLESGETVRWRGRPSVVPALWTVSKALAVGGVGLVIWLSSEGYVDPGRAMPSMPASSPATLVGSVLIGVGVMGAVTPLVGWVGISYLLTDRAVYRKHGLLVRLVRSQSLTEVRDVTTTQPLLGKLGSFGTVHVETAEEVADDETLVLTHVPEPETVATRIRES